MQHRRLGLTLGPVLYLWDEARWRDFYFRVADEAEVDTVVVGETICSKREHFHANVTTAVVDRLAAAGKTVRLASLALVTLERERKSVRRLAEQDALELEVGELSAHAALRGKPHSVGPLVNVYNAATAQVLGARGAVAICLPAELPMHSIAQICQSMPAMRFEVFGFGRVPLAISARCAHARFKGLTRDNCQFVCGDDPDGLPVDTLDGQPFLALNGVQTVSSTCHAVIGDLGSLRNAGVDAIRLSPQVCDMVAVSRIFRAVIDGSLDAGDAWSRLGEAYPEAQFANGFLHSRPGHHLVLQ
ncbi:MAG: U32 family peptidase [Devosia nanyangense]|uniref:Ubiquinone biosynthesis protein UbiV n=1 Tax=Devosia nanyangense TaxID=1228055 RepID=A0A933L597_9HYPH|nr:U32 family peptidase [Devosia nanyangense]